MKNKIISIGLVLVLLLTFFSSFVFAEASLTSSISATPTTVAIGDTITVIMKVTNNGDKASHNTAPSTLTIGGGGSVILLTGPDPTSQQIPQGGKYKEFTWTYTAVSAGTVNFTGNASGTSGSGGPPVSSTSTTSNNVIISGPSGALTSSISATPGTVTPGQTITVVMTVNNTGGEQVNGVTPSSLNINNPALVSSVSGPSPAPTDIAAGGSQDFTWTYKAESAGTVNFAGSASGTGKTSGSSISSASTTSDDVTILASGALTSSISATPGTVTPGQTITVVMTVNNTGGEQVNGVTPSSLNINNPALVSSVSGPSPAPTDIAAGGSQDFTWTYKAESAGTVNFAGSASGTGKTSGSSISSTSTTSDDVTILASGALTSSISATPGTVTPGQTITVVMTVNNTGGEQVNGVTPSSLNINNPALVSSVSGPSPAPTDIAAGGSQDFTWTYKAESAGTVNFAGSASGTGKTSGSSISSASTTSDDVTILASGALTSSISATPGTVTPGQTITVVMTVNNTGGEQVNGVTPSSLNINNPALVSSVSGPSPAPTDIAAGGSQDFTWTYKAESAGTVNFAGSASGTGKTSGSSISSASTTSDDVTILASGALTSSISATPGTVTPGQTITVVMTVNNTGGEQVNGVTPSSLNINNPALVSSVSGPSPAPTDIAAGGSQDFTWTYKAESAGTVNFAGSASGTGKTSGSSISSTSTTSDDVTILASGALTSSISATPGTVTPGQTITVVMTVNNTGGEQVNGVTPSSLNINNPALVSSVSGPSPAPTDIAAGGSQDFTWTYKAESAGTVNFAGSASGTGKTSGSSISSTSTTSDDVTILGKNPLPEPILFPGVSIQQLTMGSVGSNVIHGGKAITALEVAPGTQDILIEVKNNGFLTQIDVGVSLEGLPHGVSYTVGPQLQKVKAHNTATFTVTLNISPEVPEGTYQIKTTAHSRKGSRDRIDLTLVIK